VHFIPECGMATDIPRVHQRPITAAAGRRLPLGFGLLLAAGVSIGLWFLAYAFLRSLF